MVDTFFSALRETPPDARDHDLTSAPQFPVGRAPSFPRLLRIVAACWIAYVGLLYLLDMALEARTPQVASLPPLYYLFHAGAALIVLVIAASAWAQRRMGRAFLPTVIVCLSALPLVITALVTPLATGPISGTRGLLNLRFAPVVLLGMVLIAWNYPWKSVVLAHLALFLLTVVPAVLNPQLAPVTVVMALLQTFGTLILSYFIGVLVEQLRRQRTALRHANRQLRHYASTLEHLTISRERNRVARELHDTLAHTLSSLSVQLETVKAYWSVEPQVAQELLEAALIATRSGLHETRRALDALRARPLDDVGLRIALGDMITAVAELANLELDLTLPNELPVLEPGTEQAIYRIVQEALANVAHHADAQRLTVKIISTEAQLTLLIRDDGRGFDQQASRPAGHFGLAGMSERAALIGGQLAISSAPGVGTLVALTLAFDEGEAHAFADL